MDGKLYTLSEVASLLHVNRNAVGRLLDSGILPYLVLGSRKVRANALEEFLKQYEGWDISDPYHPSKI